MKLSTICRSRSSTGTYELSIEKIGVTTIIVDSSLHRQPSARIVDPPGLFLFDIRKNGDHRHCYYHRSISRSKAEEQTKKKVTLSQAYACVHVESHEEFVVNLP